MPTVMNITVQLPPSPEFCLLWFWTDWWPMCMTKAEWSAWFQAIFSVVAIAAAIGIAMWQRHSDRRSANETARATAMVIGAATDSSLHMTIATLTALLDEHEHPSRPTAAERAQFAQTLFGKTTLPTEEQMILLATAVPNAAATMANGIAAVKRVLVSLDFVASAPALTTLPEAAMLKHYLGSRSNLLTALKLLQDARAEMLSFANAEVGAAFRGDQP